MRVLVAIALCLIFPVTAAATELKRLTLRQDLLGWEAVGRVDLGESGYCTGVLISNTLVLTAAHCVYDDGMNRRDPAAMTFRAGLRDGVAVVDSAVKRVVAHPDYVTAGRDGYDKVRYDVALLELAEAIPSGRASPFRVASPNRVSQEVSVVSYARGRSKALSRERSCNVLGRQRGLLAFDCDVYFGSSGAPVFDYSSGQARIVSIISAGSRTKDGTVSFGMELPDLVDTLKYALRTGNGVWPEASGFSARRLNSPDARPTTGARFVRP